MFTFDKPNMLDSSTVQCHWQKRDEKKWALIHFSDVISVTNVIDKKIQKKGDPQD